MGDSVIRTAARRGRRGAGGCEKEEEEARASQFLPLAEARGSQRPYVADFLLDKPERRFFVARASHYLAGRHAEIADLRRKFEEDKQKVALMRMSRKFKPY